MKKIVILIIFFVTLSILFSLIFINFLDKSPENYSWTKAICNNTHCQDYEIICDGKNIISQNPIIGAVIKISNDWEDPREEKIKNSFCNK
jgi:hypothetical protein